jgi:predicted nucleic acid-binding Zn ribbon protein
VDQARDDAGATTGPFDDAAVADALVARLTALSRDEILDFDDLLGDVIARLDTWKVAVACQLITGYISDDSFSSFRAGLVGLGRRTVEQIFADPDSLAEHPVVIDIAEGRCNRWSLDNEDLLFAASSAYTQLSDGDDDAFWKAAYARQEAVGSGEVVRRDWEPGADDAERVPERLPRLSALLPPGRWASEPKPAKAVPQADPHERCPLCGSALPTHSAGSSSRREDGTILTREFRRCLDCSRVVERTKRGDSWDAWREMDPAELDDLIVVRLL